MGGREPPHKWAERVCLHRGAELSFLRDTNPPCRPWSYSSILFLTTHIELINRYVLPPKDIWKPTTSHPLHCCCPRLRATNLSHLGDGNSLLTIVMHCLMFWLTKRLCIPRWCITEPRYVPIPPRVIKCT